MQCQIENLRYIYIVEKPDFAVKNNLQIYSRKLFLGEAYIKKYSQRHTDFVASI